MVFLEEMVSYEEGRNENTTVPNILSGDKTYHDCLEFTLILDSTFS